jgi:uncharacterized protein YegJ (DUF2314 family)
MFMTNRWTRFERRSAIAGLVLFVAGLAGAFDGLGDAVRAETKPAKGRRKVEIQKVAGVDPNSKEFEEKMEKAMDQAFEKLDDFIAVLKKPKPTQADFAIKYLAIEGDEGEYVWASGLKYGNKEFTGKIDNKPQFVKKVKFGDPITIKEDDVVDWMYIEDGKLQGGYTLRAQRAMLTGEDRKKFDEQFKFKWE